VQGKRNKTTEESSLYRNLEKMRVDDILSNINIEDQKVPVAVSRLPMEFHMAW